MAYFCIFLRKINILSSSKNYNINHYYNNYNFKLSGETKTLEHFFPVALPAGVYKWKLKSHQLLVK